MGRAIRPEEAGPDAQVHGAAGHLTAHIPIVVLSAHAYVEDEARALHHGAAAFLRKPCPPDELVATMLRVSESCRQKQEAAGSGQPAAAV